MNFLFVFIGGGIGSALRYLIGLGFLKTSISLPWSTFVSNMVASGVYGFTLWFMANKEVLNESGFQANSAVKLLILTGFCGGLSTFSTFGYETFLMFRQGLFLVAFLNILVSIFLSLLLFYIFIKHNQ